MECLFSRWVSTVVDFFLFFFGFSACDRFVYVPGLDLLFFLCLYPYIPSFRKRSLYPKFSCFVLLWMYLLCGCQVFLLFRRFVPEIFKFVLWLKSLYYPLLGLYIRMWLRCCGQFALPSFILGIANVCVVEFLGLISSSSFVMENSFDLLSEVLPGREGLAF